MRSLKSVSIAAAAVLIAGAVYAQPGKFRVLYSFTGGSDGNSPQAGLVMDKAGNLYGTTLLGGAFFQGTVFKLAPDGTETVLHAFNGDGAKPTSSLLFDKQGNLYGTTSAGGKGCKRGCGVLFKLAPDGTYTVLHYFKGNRDGHFPASGLAFDTARNLYGVTPQGGAHGDCGTLFKSARDGGEIVLASFNGMSQSCLPYGPPLPEMTGNFFIPTLLGGTLGDGAVLEISSKGEISLFYSFQGGNHAGGPEAGLIADNAGNLYGTTAFAGGSLNCAGGCGAVFRLSPDGQETLLHAFQGSRDGARPMAALAMDDAGNLYGTTEFGGINKDCSIDDGCGTVFKVAPDGTETVLHRFASHIDGALPLGNLIADKHGNLYGTAATGGAAGGGGTVFLLK